MLCSDFVQVLIKRRRTTKYNMADVFFTLGRSWSILYHVCVCTCVCVCVCVRECASVFLLQTKFYSEKIRLFLSQITCLFGENECPSCWCVRVFSAATLWHALHKYMNKKCKQERSRRRERNGAWHYHYRSQHFWYHQSERCLTFELVGSIHFPIRN